MLTNEDLRKMFNELDKQTGACTSNVEVKFNGRLSTTIGRFKYLKNGSPVSFEFAGLLKKLSYEDVNQIVIHEYAHYLRNCYFYKGTYGHDEEFKRIVRSLGGTETEPKISNIM